MRTASSAVALTLGLALAGCKGSARAGVPAAANTTPAGPATAPAAASDQFVLRLPRSGGATRAYAFPRVDSLVWSSSARAPGIDRTLGFDDELGDLLAIDDRGDPVRIDLRMGSVTRSANAKLTRLAAGADAAIYGIAGDGSITRLTPSGTWTYKPPAPVRGILPAPDGSLLLLADRTGGTTVWQMHPPDKVLTDTARMPRLTRALSTQVGDRVYFTVDSGLVGLSSRGLDPIPSIRLDHPVRAVATTPSGDRLFIATDSSRELLVVDRYSRDVEARVRLPGYPVELRMDPTGRMVLARAAHGDSAWVIPMGSDVSVSTVRTAWRSDLPTVAPNGWLVLLRGADVVFVDPRTHSVVRTVAKGASDTWLFVEWSGFRPRLASLDEPVTFRGVGSGRDSALADSVIPDSGRQGVAAGTLAPSSPDSLHRAGPPAPDTARHASGDSTLARGAVGFTIQFAALRSESAARAVAAGMHLEGAAPRVVATNREGIAVYRVVVGPFPTRAAADRVARTSDRAYWIYEGAP